MIGVAWSLVMAALFGFSQLASRKGLSEIAVDQGTFIMIVVSTILMAFPFFWLGGPALLIQTNTIGLAYFVAAGLVHFIGGFTLMNTSISTIGAAQTGSLIATTPLFATFLAAVALDELLNAPLIIGVGLVVGGVILIGRSRRRARSKPTTATGQPDSRGVAPASIFGLLAAVSWGFSPVLIKKGLESLPSPVVGLTLSMVSAGVVYAVILGVRGRLRPIFSQLGQTGGLWQIGAGALIGFGTLARWIALSFTTAAMVTTLSRASLFITVGLGGKLLGNELEPINAQIRWGALLIVIGSIIVVLFGRP